jgi:hypothetical protein
MIYSRLFRLILACLFTLLLGLQPVGAQLAYERMAWNNLAKQKWTKAEAHLEKALRKDSLNAVTYYVLAHYFFKAGNPSFQIDSAQLKVEAAIERYQKSSKRDRERLLRFPLDSALLTTLAAAIDSAAFARAKMQNTEVGYTFFIDHFPKANQRIQAIELQHEVAYVDALKENTYQSFLSYLQRYPQSARATEAQKRYDFLLYEVSTKDKRLANYVAFLQSHPQTPYRNQAERIIFEISTASGDTDVLEDFIQNHAANKYATVARNFLFHIYKEQERSFTHLLTDSLQKAQQLQSETWFPIWKNGAYSFIDSDGSEHLTNVSNSIDASFLCEGFNDDVIWIGNKLVARNGKVLAESVQEYENLGYGFLQVQTPSGWRVLDKSGRLCLESDHAVQLVGHQFFLQQQKGISTLYSLSGKKLLSDMWKSVAWHGNVVTFETEKGWRLIHTSAIGATANGEAIALTPYYDEVKQLTPDYLWVRVGKKQALLNDALTEIIPMADQHIDIDHRVIVVSNNTHARYFLNNKLSAPYKTIKVLSDWVIAKHDSYFDLHKNSNAIDEPIGANFDSLYAVGDAAVGVRNDSTFLYVAKSVVALDGAPNIESISATDASYFVVHENDNKTVFTSTGNKLFSIVCDKLEYVGAGFFVSTRKEKKTVLGKNGKPLSIAFDALGNASSNTLSVLMKKKFGLVNFQSQKEIKPEYDRNIWQYKVNLLVACKDKACGFLDWNNVAQSKFEFEEVRYWNDSIALVKQAFAWRFYDLVNKSVRSDKISEYTSFQKSPTETISIFKQDNYYGVMSSKHGNILEPTFTTIKNLGTGSEPFYFTEKFIEEAAIYVVIYYNQAGKQVHRLVFEEDDYARIKCVD